MIYLILFGAMLTLMAVVAASGYHYGAARRPHAPDEPVAPMLLCPRCGPDTVPFSMRHHEAEVATMAARGYAQIGRLN